MYCKFCGQEIGTDSKFCRECGKNIKEQNDNTLETKIVDNGHNSIYKNPKTILCLLWWTLLALIGGFIAYNDHHRVKDILTVFFIYLGVILLVYTIYYYKKHKDSIQSSEQSSKESAPQSPKVYSLQEFADIYGKMQILRSRDDYYGVTHSKCIFTRTKTVNVWFGNEIGELSAKEIVINKENLLVQERLYDDDFYLIAKPGSTIIRQQ